MSSQTPQGALLIAEYLLWKAQQEGVQITNKKMQKLLYYVQAWSAAINNKPMFNDKIEAWIHGPAIKSVYLAFQEFGANPIVKEINSARIESISAESRLLIDKVWNVYKKYDGDYLEMLTHNEDPWQQARGKVEPHMRSESEITLDSMRKFYAAKLVS